LSFTDLYILVIHSDIILAKAIQGLPIKAIQSLPIKVIQGLPINIFYAWQFLMKV